MVILLVIVIVATNATLISELQSQAAIEHERDLWRPVQATKGNLRHLHHHKWGREEGWSLRHGSWLRSSG